MSYFVYILLTIFLGIFGLDHLALRSPLTALLKFLSIVPLLGFWYFYDIAQALGEREYVEKYGIGVPFYGPTGIAAGMFTGTKEFHPAPKEIPGPWRYFAYVLTTGVLFMFPINKFVLGDYMGGVVHILFYILFPLTFIAILWSFYDIYQVLFKTRDLFEKGVPRMVPASSLLGQYFRRDAIGPYPPPPPPPPTWFQRFFNAWLEVPISAGKTVSKTIDVGRDATVGVVDTGITTTQSVVKGVGSVVEGVGEGTKMVTTAAASEVKDLVTETGDVASSAIQAAKTATDAVSDTIVDGAKAAQGTVALVGKIPEIGEKVASEMSNTSKIVEEAKKGATAAALANTAQAGGALLLVSELPSVSTSVLLFSVALVAFSGYVFYTMRNTYKKPEKSDDPPREPATVRSPAKPSE
jgi:TM2 domain-containing membrane protein YozV